MNRPPIVVGLTGAAGSGKDTAAEFMVDLLRKGHRCNAVRWAFADALRQMLLPIVPPLYMHDRRLKEQPVPGLGVSYRMLAQTLGTEWGRNLIAQDLWVRIMDNRLARLVEMTQHSPPIVVVVSDVRFPNELRWIRERGGHLVRITRPDAAEVRAHESELHTAEFATDQRISNDSSLPVLQARVDLCLQKLQASSDFFATSTTNGA